MQPLASDDPQQIGPHRLLARLGAGGMGQVYLARTPEGHLCALKVVKEDLAHDTQFRARFAREIRTAQRVRGPFTPAVVDSDPDSGQPWMATEYVPGPTLKEAVAASGPFPEPSLLVLTLGLARALSAVHTAGLMHRDLKPSNILLSPRGPQVIDFGIARAVEGTVLTRTGQTFGTPSYTSPEQIVGQNVSPRSDLFSMAGAVVFAASGEPPFGTGPAATSLPRIMSGEPNLTALPEGPIRDLLTRCFDKEPARRPDTEELVRDLSALPLPSAEHGWLPSSVAQQIDLKAGETQRAEQAERTTAPSEAPPAGSGRETAAAPGPRPWWRRGAVVTGAAAASALVLAGGAALALTALPDRAEEQEAADGTGSGDEGENGDGDQEQGDEPENGQDEEDSPVEIDLFTAALDFSEDGETLYVTNVSDLSAWDWREEEVIDVFEPAPVAAYVGEDDLVVGSYDDHLQLWDGDSDSPITQLSEETDRGYYDMPALSHDGDRVATITAETHDPEGDHILQIWDVEDEGPGEDIPVEGRYTELHYTADDAFVVGLQTTENFDEDVALNVWDGQTGEEVQSLSMEDEDQFSFSLAPDGQNVVLAGSEGQAEIRDLATGEVVTELPDLTEDDDLSYVDEVGYSADGDQIHMAVSPVNDHSGSILDAATGEVIEDGTLTLSYPFTIHPESGNTATVLEDSVLILDADQATLAELS